MRAHNNGQVATITETVLGFIPLLSYMSMTPFVLLPSKTQDIENYQYMMEDMAVLPDITFLRLTVMANGHAFEASAFHVLRLSTGIRRLVLQLVATVSEVNLFFVYLILSPDTEKGSILVPKRHF